MWIVSEYMRNLGRHLLGQIIISQNYIVLFWVRRCSLNRRLASSVLRICLVSSSTNFFQFTGLQYSYLAVLNAVLDTLKSARVHHETNKPGYASMQIKSDRILWTRVYLGDGGVWCDHPVLSRLIQSAVFIVSAYTLALLIYIYGLRIEKNQR